MWPVSSRSGFAQFRHLAHFGSAMGDSSTATKLPPVDLAKARAIAAMLASNHDGEVVNAARRLVSLAKASGLSVQDLIGPVEESTGLSTADLAKALDLCNHIERRAGGSSILSMPDMMVLHRVRSMCLRSKPPVPSDLVTLMTIARKLGIV